jgi:hypothetical protein
MSFWSNKAWVTLQGIDGSRGTMVALQSIVSKPKFDGQGVLWDIEKQESKVLGSTLTKSQQLEMEALLQQYDRVLKEPSGLPPRGTKSMLLI